VVFEFNARRKTHKIRATVSGMQTSKQIYTRMGVMKSRARSGSPQLFIV